MKVKDIAKLGKLLAQFLAGFACCFTRPQGRALLHTYVRGLLSDVQRKNVEAIALDQNVAPRTLQRFLESIAAGLTDAESGRTVTTTELRERLRAWRSDR